jgi:hypothetical protein
MNSCGIGFLGVLRKQADRGKQPIKDCFDNRVGIGVLQRLFTMT